MLLPKLRRNITTNNSPDPNRPGLYIRDHFRYTDAWLIVPSPLVPVLQLFDGAHSLQDLEGIIARIVGKQDAFQTTKGLVEALSNAGFLENETYWQKRDAKHSEFEAMPVRLPAHAGTAYPNKLEALQAKLGRYLAKDETPLASSTIGIAAPHVSLNGGWRCYRAAYQTLSQDLKDRTFVILGTSHYGMPNKFGLTRKPFQTPLGTTRIDTDLVEELMNQPAALSEDYCHAIEHAVEMQVIFLQTLYGADVKILPILCGQYATSLYEGGLPEKDDTVNRFLGTLGDIAAREGNRLFWIMGVDMAHMGQRYGDRINAEADRNEMLNVRVRDLARIQFINSGDAHGYWDRIQENHDDLKWCGASPLYTFLKAVPQVRGALQKYEQWNIDKNSIVSFAGMSFVHT